MNRNTIVITMALLASATTLTACARAPGPRAAEPEAPQASTAASMPAATTAATPATAPSANPAQPLPLVVVNKSPSCGCCGAWVEHLRKAGFPVEVRDSDNLNPVKTRLQIPVGKGSCHTAEVGGYFVEGHVPADDIRRLLAEKPDAKGLVLPGMPMGSPGMETPDGTTQPYTVELVKRDGTTSAFAQHGG
uniref:PO3Cd1.13 n=1 Tax=uncultured Lysobacteraceae bacterium TaxID=211441 RepID=J9V0I2_9GAMM|nr:pO3Cd1.13 [uncultured Xanthomonadaceae bacterium]